MEQQLQRILKSNLDNIDTQLIYNEQKIEDFEDYLESKTKEFSQLQNCFMKQIKQLQKHQKNQIKFKGLISMILQMCNFFRNELYHIKCNWVQFVLWKQNYQNKLRQLPALFSHSISKRHTETEKQNVNSSNKKKQNMIEMVHMQYKYETQIQNLKNYITNLEKQIKKKIHIQRCENVNIVKIKQNEDQYYKKSMQKYLNKQSIYGQNHLSRQKSKRRILQNHNMNRQQQNEYKSSNKKLIQSKKRNQFPISEFTNSPLRINKVVSNNTVDSYKKYQIPILPQIKLNFSFVPPILNGFQILIINNKEVYKGMWKKGLFQGRGKLYTDSWIYDGQFKNGLVQGMGSINFKNYTFIGKFINGMANGEGTLYSRQKPITGIWKENVLVKQL